MSTYVYVFKHVDCSFCSFIYVWTYNNSLQLKIHDSRALVFFSIYLCWTWKTAKYKNILPAAAGRVKLISKRFVRSIRLNNNVICANCDTARLPPTLTNSWMEMRGESNPKGYSIRGCLRAEEIYRKSGFYFSAFVIMQVKISWCSCCAIVIH